MILRRLADAVRQQDWVTVAIETLIVVFGVFIGLQVNNWSGARASRAAYAEALIRFEAEIDRNIAELERATADLDVSVPLSTNVIEQLRTTKRLLEDRR